MDIKPLLLERIRRADRRGAEALLNAWAAEHGFERLLKDVLDPVLEQIGEEWRSSETFTIAQAYVAAKIAEDMLIKIAELRKISSGNSLPKRPAVIGNIEEDFHSLGRRMVGMFLRAEDWLVYDLGNDVTAIAFVDKAQETGARVLGVSAMMMTTAGNIRKVREEINKRGLAGRIQLAVGGAIFRVCPGLAEDIGGDGTAADALEAPGLFNRLWEISAEKEAGA